MVVSSAFKELSAVLARLESRGTEVQHATVDEDLTGSDGAVTAELSVGVPLLDEAETGEAVSVAAVDAAVEDGRVAVDLTVTVAGDDASTGTPEPGTTVDAAAETDARAVPAYKDPDALRAAYDRYETFPEMTEALGADVTSETVRRHMVKYDIHDPDDTASGYADTGADGRERRPDEVSDGDGQEPSAGSATETAADGTVTGAEATDAATSTEESSPQSDAVAGNAVTDGGNATVAGATRAEPPCASRPVTDVLAEADATTPGPDLELADAVTVGGLTEVINRARTVHEVGHELGVSQSAAREFLQAFDLIHFVSHPLAADQVTLSPEEVRRRLGPAGQ